MPVTRRRAAAVVVAAEAEAEEGAAAIDISSDSDAESAESESESEQEEAEASSDEDYVDISDSDEDCADISDSDADDEERSREGNEREGEGEAGHQSGVDRSEAACSKITGGRSLDGIKLVECKAYLKKNGLSQIGDMSTCVERITLHWRFRDGDPEKIYPRSSFCINCKGDVCRGDTVLFKQKVYEKSGKRHSKCIGKRIVAGKVFKESYGKEKQQHTFTIQVFWSKGVGKLPPLSLLLVKGRNLYRMMTFRQTWSNEADRAKAVEEKHSRGDAARRVRALNRPNSGVNAVLKGKKYMDKGKYQSQPGLLDGGSRITKAKKRVMQSSGTDLPNKKSRKEEHPASSGKNRTAGGRKAKTNCTPLDKNIGTSNSSSLCNNRDTNHVILQKNSHVAPVDSIPRSTELRASKRKTGSKKKKTAGGSHAQFEESTVSSASHTQAYHRNLVGIHQPFFQRPQRPPPLHEVGNFWQPRM
ncbi:zinc finger CCCH domain-containing protein 62 isoform X2 [Brachypodium distachyon]|uniref:DUF7699 domain-containing protein n=1 Tax=Brachypodium distachyon TaxID=15368 RepID=A0A0Q3GW17_BRADI|nr:zinc finger CCCH domain-containing protein 62 isoform X2 [Brachypodium distachyon]KQK15165.1 hypothetical protein BRADI_1g21102v3 [Brachypodium distachyon]KQK15175.1 hypothetical protein BRADI_1g21102v3 [Brachypodium distachyon]KQK15183.1 hypothetical protein BRADI_1g21102v3 [Brachypodium distachyon]PNT74726.1 hypothetical protein BRADI_1g21102v3 [Brachypodium distachyon]|eukprot:XP_024317516.1 zinc finger CCCH domain-containing protein 62 isoform X2 [Brachypodium distachyon]